MDQRHSKLYTEEAASEGIRLSQLQFSARNKLQQADFDREFRSVLCLELVRIAAAAAAWHHQRSHSPEAVVARIPSLQSVQKGGEGMCLVYHSGLEL